MIKETMKLYRIKMFRFPLRKNLATGVHKVLQLYKIKMYKYPWRTNIITATGLMCIGDIMA